jgi:RNA polymerase sigma factor (sigma-70 family)
MIKLDPQLVAAARQGSRVALEALVLALQGPVFNLAARMLANRPDAEDATQEILIKVITHLGDLREGEAAGAWAFRIACRHLVHSRRRGRVEAQRLTFRAFAADLADGLEALPDETVREPETQVLIEAVEIGFTRLADAPVRPLRAAYILAEILSSRDVEAAHALEIDQAAFRQRLRRARALVTGLCKQVRHRLAGRRVPMRARGAQALRLGRVEKSRSLFAARDPSVPSVAQVRASIARLECKAAALMRSNPQFATDVRRLLVQVIDAG